MAPKDSKDGHHHRLSSLFHGKKKEPRIKKGLGEALGAIGLRPDEDGECISGDCVRSTVIHSHYTSYQTEPRTSLIPHPSPVRTPSPTPPHPSHAFFCPHIISASARQFVD